MHNGPTLTPHYNHLVFAPFIGEEIKVALFNVNEDKASSLDGYYARFFHHTGVVIGQGISMFELCFLYNGKLLIK